MTNKERRDAQMAYISDGSIFEEQQICRKKLQKLNFMDRYGRPSGASNQSKFHV